MSQSGGFKNVKFQNFLQPWWSNDSQTFFWGTSNNNNRQKDNELQQTDRQTDIQDWIQDIQDYHTKKMNYQRAFSYAIHYGNKLSLTQLVSWPIFLNRLNNRKICQSNIMNGTESTTSFSRWKTKKKLKNILGRKNDVKNFASKFFPLYIRERKMTQIV